MTNEKKDLEGIILIDGVGAWDFNGFEIDLNKKVRSEISMVISSKRYTSDNKCIEFGDGKNSGMYILSKNPDSEILKNLGYVKGRITADDLENSNAYVLYLMLRGKNGAILQGKIDEFSCNKKGKPMLYGFGIPKKMSIIPLGIGNGFSVKNDNTCFILDSDKLYLIDCPEDLSKLGHLEDQIGDAILTHNDPDHVGALRKLIQKKCFYHHEKFNIHTTKFIFEDFKRSLRGLQSALKNTVVFRELRPDKKFVSPKGFGIEVRDNNHGDVPTIGLKFTYKGKKLGYSSDCRYPGEIGLKKEFKNDVKELNTYLAENKKSSRHMTGKESFLDGVKKVRDEKLEYLKNIYSKLSFSWFSDCDMIIHEATDNPNDPVHTDIKELRKLPLSIREKILLAHIPDEFLIKNYADIVSFRDDDGIVLNTNNTSAIYIDKKNCQIYCKTKYKEYVSRMIPMVPGTKYFVN